MEDIKATVVAAAEVAAAAAEVAVVAVEGMVIGLALIQGKSFLYISLSGLLIHLFSAFLSISACLI